MTSRVGTTSALIAAIPFASHLSRLINAAQYTRDVLILSFCVGTFAYKSPPGAKLATSIDNANRRRGP